jgi:hypothetical protein
LESASGQPRDLLSASKIREFDFNGAQYWSPRFHSKVLLREDESCSQCLIRLQLH